MKNLLIAAAIYFSLGLVTSPASAEMSTEELLIKARIFAEQGNASAQFILGTMYANGEGVLEDDREAVAWYRKAAEQGHASAQSNLGKMYAKGEGVTRNLVKAYAWFNLSAAQGNETAKSNKEIGVQRMSSTQITAAQALSRQYSTRIAQGLPAENNISEPAPARSAVREAQQLLTSLGYQPGPVDGLMGKRTRQAIRAAQSDQRQIPTGKITEELLQTLRKRASIPGLYAATPD